MNWTKGKWHVKENGGKGELVGVASEGSNWFIAEEVLANDAHLIAASPTLYEALARFEEPATVGCGPHHVRCVYCYATWDPKGGDNHFQNCPTLQARAALAKARGEV